MSDDPDTPAEHPALDEYLTVYEIAALLKLNQQTVRNTIDRGDLPAVRFGPRRVRVRRTDLEAFIASRPGADAPERPTLVQTIEALQERVEALTARLEALERNNDDGNALGIAHRIGLMRPEIGQEVYVPDPDGNPVRATVTAHGGPEDAVEVVIDGQDAKRDVAVVRHEDGPSKGFVAHVPYELISTDPPA